MVYLHRMPLACLSTIAYLSVSECACGCIHVLETIIHANCKLLILNIAYVSVSAKNYKVQTRKVVHIGEIRTLTWMQSTSFRYRCLQSEQTNECKNQSINCLLLSTDRNLVNWRNISTALEIQEYGQVVRKFFGNSTNCDDSQQSVVNNRFQLIFFRTSGHFDSVYRISSCWSKSNRVRNSPNVAQSQCNANSRRTTSFPFRDRNTGRYSEARLTI